ncbi:MAG: Gfo/Idh/MocA family oxidoreductase [Pirellulales bacterium]|nr:Gfo/Idh/MocA family oxidoreductase [Pirellulales bacterium]
MDRPLSDASPLPSRRTFLKHTAVTAATTALASRVAFPGGAHAASSDVLKIGLIGCGGRGTGAAANALAADQNVKLWAMGDTFSDRLESSLANIRKEAAAKVDVSPERCFVGFDAYQQVIDSGVDVVVLATPPHFRPQHLAAAVAAGKHVFAEKPVAVDGPGVRSVLATVEEAKKKNLSLVSGLCWRYDSGMRETFARVHDGALGDIVAMQVNYNVGGLWMHPRKEGWSDMEWQIRNWLYFTWLSGDHNVEQHVHSLDKAAWTMKDQPPLRATGLGGRQVRTGSEYGHIFDHHAVVYEYPNDVKLFAFTRQQNGCSSDVNDYLMGTKGTCDVMKHEIRGETKWRYRGEKPNMYQVEHDELFASIRSGNPRNDGHYMSYSTMLAILGRMATYTGQTITWEQAMNSQEDLSPAKYEWGDLPVAPVAMPGVTRFV